MSNRFFKAFTSPKSSAVSSTKLFAIKEAYKTIRTNILLNLDEKPCHIITLTSSLPGEGKSTSCINLSISIAQFDKKVLMIDTDLRKKKATKYLKFSTSVGLAEVIKGEIKVEDAIKVTKYPNFDFLSSGGHVSNPSELLASRTMASLLEKLSAQYDYIIIDTPPINVVSDALPLIKLSDGVVLVARENVATYKDFKKLISSLELIEASIMGIIYIGTDSTVPYYHASNYGNKYGKYSSYYSSNE